MSMPSPPAYAYGTNSPYSLHSAAGSNGLSCLVPFKMISYRCFVIDPNAPYVFTMRKLLPTYSSTPDGARAHRKREARVCANERGCGSRSSNSLHTPQNPKQREKGQDSNGGREELCGSTARSGKCLSRTEKVYCT